MEKNNKQLNWAMISLIAFNLVWGLGNVVNNYAQQGLSVVTSWVIILVIYLIPYALMVGQLGATFKEQEGGVTDWIANTSTKRLAFFAAWTYWVTQIPYLAQKSQVILISLGWIVQGNGDFLSSLSTPALVGLELLAFLFLLYLSTKGLKALKYLGTLAGGSMLVMSLLFILLAVALPAIKPDLQLATANMDKVPTYIPKFDFVYLTTIALLVFSVGGAESMSPYVNKAKNPAKEFPKGMIAMVIMVGVCAIFGSFGMAMLFDSNNIPADLMRNGAYQAFDVLGQHWGIGRLLVFIYAVTQFLGQASVLALNVDSHMQIFLGSADKDFIPGWLRKRSKTGTLVNGYILTGVLVSILIALPLLGLKQIDSIVHWLTNLNAIVLPTSYLWVFLAFIFLYRNWDQYKNAQYIFIKNKKLGVLIGGWGFCFTAFACILGMFPQIDMDKQPTEWWFTFLTNIITPVLLLAIGLILPWLARREQKAKN
ncbi:putative transport protein [Streptococcus sp. DD11]|uniref:APC family permease n=1 Tax=Streptococcus sp. DD11 TaxID=1777879 RepID=UPI000794321B|nr:amino acid permease [Streptococcus sp. DD11]KXT79673.1 putative transport protein [Streptococcus sp. DD11]